MVKTKSLPATSGGQIPLFEPIPTPDFSGKKFLVSSSNEAVLEMAQAWLISGEPALAICGPAGSGKSHLGFMIGEHIRCGGSHLVESILINADDVKVSADTTPNKASLRIIDAIGSDDSNHVHGPLITNDCLLEEIENCRMQEIRLILIGREKPPIWAGDLPDLYTRLEAMPRIHMPEPDEALMRVVLMQHLHDRQLRIEEDELQSIADFAAVRLPRTFTAIEAFTRALDLQALSEKKKPGMGMAKRVITAMAST